MTIITRLTTAFSGADAAALPRLSWASGLNPNRRFKPESLGDSGTTINTWLDALGGGSLAKTGGPVVGVEAGVKYAAFDGVDDGLALSGLTDTTIRTVVAIARPNTGDVYAGTTSSPIVNCGGTQMYQVNNGDIARMNSTGSTLAAVRDKWHFYAMSVPASGDATFVIDGNTATITLTSNSQTSIRLAWNGASNFRQLRIAEVLTSADVATSAALIAAYAKAKAWYSGLAWV